MKKQILVLALLLMVSLVSLAQVAPIFQGVPVDGSKREMIRKLEAKGFVYDSKSDFLLGELDGIEVYLKVVEDNGKVWRLMVVDNMLLDAPGAKYFFNLHCKRFYKDDGYVSLNAQRPMIPDDEDIDYEMSANHKEYTANFYQDLEETPGGGEEIQRLKRKLLLKKFTPEEIEEGTDEVACEIMDIAADMRRFFYESTSVWIALKRFSEKGFTVYTYYDNLVNCPE